MTTKDEALKLALEALEESVDLVREDYENAKKLYGKYPSRQARLLGMEDGLLKHENAITAIKQALAAPVQEPVAHDEDWLEQLFGARGHRDATARARHLGDDGITKGQL
jgi:hypothetical protein